MGRETHTGCEKEREREREREKEREDGRGENVSSVTGVEQFDLGKESIASAAEAGEGRLVCTILRTKQCQYHAYYLLLPCLIVCKICLPCPSVYLVVYVAEFLF